MAANNTRLPAIISRARKKEAARLIELGTSDEVVAIRLGIDLPEIGRLIDDPEIRELIGELQLERREKAAGHVEQFDSLMAESFAKLRDKLSDPDTTLDDVRKLFESLADRHPSGQFAKQSKTSTKVSGKVSHDHSNTQGALDVYARAASLPAPTPFRHITDAVATVPITVENEA